jgi:hypothetical protein
VGYLSQLLGTGRAQSVRVGVFRNQRKQVERRVNLALLALHTPEFCFSDIRALPQFCTAYGVATGDRTFERDKKALLHAGMECVFDYNAGNYTRIKRVAPSVKDSLYVALWLSGDLHQVGAWAYDLLPLCGWGDMTPDQLLDIYPDEETGTPIFFNDQGLSKLFTKLW